MRRFTNSGPLSLTSLTSLTIAVALSMAGPSFAQDGAGKDDQGEVRRDPKGVKGISPYREHLAKARTAFANGDKNGALKALDAAIAEDGARMMAYVLKAQVQLSNGDLAGAIDITKQAKNKRGNERQTSKLLFLSADLEERNAAPPSTEEKKSKLSEALRSTWEKVKENWTTYATYLTTHTAVPNYSATATERKKQVDARVKREEDYGAVAERIKKNQEERDRKKK
jgi:hypothetical protein